MKRRLARHWGRSALKGLPPILLRCEIMTDTRKANPVGDRITKDARDWVVRLASGTITDAELSRFKAWREMSEDHARAFANERTFWQQLDALDDRHQAQGKRGTGKTASAPRLGRRALLIGSGAVAASAAGLIVAPRLKLILGADYRTAPGELSEVTLADGTRVTLNTDSALALHFQPRLRLVELLQGEALFEVKANAHAPFRVAALGHNIDSVGTAFAVRAVGDEGTITVTDGRVRVSGPAAADTPPASLGASVNVGASEQTRYLKGKVPARASVVDLEAALAWRSGRIIFDGRPFPEALAELGRYVPERVVLATRATATEPVSAVFSTREASTAIVALAQTQGLAARRIPGVMILVS